MVRINIVKEGQYAIKKIDVTKIPKDAVIAWKIYNKDDGNLKA